MGLGQGAQLDGSERPNVSMGAITDGSNPLVSPTSPLGLAAWYNEVDNLLGKKPASSDQCAFLGDTNAKMQYPGSASEHQSQLREVDRSGQLPLLTEGDDGDPVTTLPPRESRSRR